MREIKFRAWDKHGKRIIKPCNSFHFEFGQIKHTFWDASPLEKHYDLMQYTGLKDKNGVEIYEGDILSIDGGKNTAKVSWCLDAWTVGLYLISHYINDMEVVGNIYQNPELLEDN